MFSEEETKLLSHCTICPRECGVNRFTSRLGYCKSDAAFHISSVCIHKGEEPVISGEKGICNVFFSRCNLQCVYCQNHDISRNNAAVYEDVLSLEETVAAIKKTLARTENIVGFVSPSHFVPHVKAIIRGLREAGLNPVFVYNTNGYDKAASLKELEGLIDVYLPDFKYIDPELAFVFSQARDYANVASAALKEMYRQKGSRLSLNERGIAESGIIVRHLVLPGAVQNSIDVLRFIAEEISEKLHISLMAQYYPTPHVRNIPELNRTLREEEYNQVVDAFHSLGFYRGWVQELESHHQFRPSFGNEQPFEL